jgi:hypothetical protein
MTNTRERTAPHHRVPGRLEAGVTAAILAAALFGSPAPARAAGDSPRLQFSWSGFATLAVGKVLDSTQNGSVAGYEGPAYIADYMNPAVYEGRKIDIRPDSKVGLQGTVAYGKSFDVTGQVVFRGARDGRPDLEWVYATFRASDDLSFQVGRKRLPIFYYSDSQDVGLSFPWVRLPQQVYGWEIVNYNGASVAYHLPLGSWSSRVSLFGGGERKNDNGFWKLYNGEDTRTDSRWSKIAGLEWNVSHAWFEGRLVYIQSDIQNKAPGDTGFSPAAKQRIYGTALNADYEDLVVRSEFYYMDRTSVFERDYGMLFGIGYRFGKILPMLTYSRYRQSFIPNADFGPSDQEAHADISALVRYDVTTSSALKIQYDTWRDRSGPNFAPVFFGSSKLLALCYDRVF